MNNPNIINPVLKRGMVMIDPESGQAKVGDGRRHWNDLSFTVGVAGPTGLPGANGSPGAPGASGSSTSISSTTNLLIGDGSGGASSSGINPATVLISGGALGTPASGDATNLTGLPGSSVSGALPSGALIIKMSDILAVLPFILYIKTVSVLTTGTPADIASISVPAAITRWRGGGTGASSGAYIVAESASGTLAGANFQANDATGGGGTTMWTTAAGPAAAGQYSVFPSGTAATVISTGSTIYIRQTADSANAGTVSFYFKLFPLI